MDLKVLASICMTEDNIKGFKDNIIGLLKEEEQLYSSDHYTKGFSDFMNQIVAQFIEVFNSFSSDHITFDLNNVCFKTGSYKVCFITVDDTCFHIHTNFYSAVNPVLESDGFLRYTFYLNNISMPSRKSSINLSYFSNNDDNSGDDGAYLLNEIQMLKDDVKKLRVYCDSVKKVEDFYITCSNNDFFIDNFSNIKDLLEAI